MEQTLKNRIHITSIPKILETNNTLRFLLFYWSKQIIMICFFLIETSDNGIDFLVIWKIRIIHILEEFIQFLSRPHFFIPQYHPEHLDSNQWHHVVI